MGLAKIMARLGLGAALVCAGMAGLAVGAGQALPDSGEIAFTSAEYDIYLVDLGHNIAQNLTTRLDLAASGPVWSPDGDELAFVAHSGTEEATRVFVMTRYGRDLQELADFGGRTLELVWSPDGQQIAMSSDGWIYVLQVESPCLMADLVNSRCRYNDLSGDLTGRVSDWSPAGSQILFYVDRAAGGIYTVNPDGSLLRQLAETSRHNVKPQWSPDGQSIAFVSVRDRAWRLFLMNSDEADPRLLVTNAFGIYSFAWSPDGSALLYSAYDGEDLELYKIDIESGAGQRLTRNTAHDSFAFWSRDGSRIAFTSYESEEIELYVMDADGSHMRLITTLVGTYDARAAWRPQR